MMEDLELEWLKARFEKLGGVDAWLAGATANRKTKAKDAADGIHAEVCASGDRDLIERWVGELIAAYRKAGADSAEAEVLAAAVEAGRAALAETPAKSLPPPPSLTDRAVS